MHVLSRECKRKRVTIVNYIQGPVRTWQQRQIKTDDVVEQIGATPIHDDVIKYLIYHRRQVWMGPHCKNHRRHRLVRTSLISEKSLQFYPFNLTSYCSAQFYKVLEK